MHEKGIRCYGIESDEPTRLKCQVAAKMLGISKKTLDDYKSVFQKANKYKFNFLEINENAKMGVLRNFIKEKE
jgi:hypothetical protein